MLHWMKTESCLHEEAVLADMPKCFRVAMNQASSVCAAVLVVCAVKRVKLWAGCKVH
jgi:hypothetical protein